ncbi:PadR family transcriptional regulator [Paenibacillus sp. J2TS4]|uniref:PadR family transcriptional regulator n=1 Tax=Paenibacillus sp. J2TS4 TaxID=2807194 RepID=UPI001B20F411|nr:PadR family transcriptional regulator [Paenibacillus sp. J2TS4]GIP35443.1 PadR family transcriptional regulator [Paenibacillus sp. J2TS4]
MKINKELMKGSTATLLLHLLERKERYGYEMIKELDRQSDGIFKLKEGTLYPIMHAMESSGLVEAYWSEQGGRNRKYYRITNEGKKQLADKKQEWTTFRTAVDRLLGEGSI